MKSPGPFTLSMKTFSLFLTILVVALSAGSLTNCSSGSPAPGGNTQVIVLLSSTANDQLVSFNASIASILLFDTTGKSTTVYINPDTFTSTVEWTHLNGASEPLLSASIPQGTYTSAIVTIAGCSFTNETFAANTFNTATFAQGLCSQGSGQSTVDLPNPIKVAGSAMALSLNLQVSQSYTLTGSGNSTQYTISPVFTLAPVSIAAHPTDETNGKVIGVYAHVTSVGMDGKSFVAKTAAGASLDLSSSAGTTYQGIAGFSSLAAGLLVNLDAGIQSDGSLVATRIEVDDSTAPAAAIGPFTVPGNLAGEFLTQTLQQNGCSVVIAPLCLGIYDHNNHTSFNVSGELTNLASLPFQPAFNGSTLLQGQNLAAYSSGTLNAQLIQDATTLTLASQTLNGTVTAISNDSGFAVYAVSLAPYDLIPLLQNYTSNSPPPHLTNPTSVVIYADTSARFLNSGMINVGSLLRFRGVVFFDNGTARMDCDTILDGVPE